MPIREYVCRECGHEIERLQRLSDASLVDCPACGAAALKRKISAAGFRLSGGGWYETDFKSDDRRNLAGGEDKKQAADDKSDKSTGETTQAGDAGGAADKSAQKSADKGDKPAAKSDSKKTDTNKSGDKKSGADQSGDNKSAGKRA